MLKKPQSIPIKAVKKDAAPYPLRLPRPVLGKGSQLLGMGVIGAISARTGAGSAFGVGQPTQQARRGPDGPQGGL